MKHLTFGYLVSETFFYGSSVYKWTSFIVLYSQFFHFIFYFLFCHFTFNDTYQNHSTQVNFRLRLERSPYRSRLQKRGRVWISSYSQNVNSK